MSMPEYTNYPGAESNSVSEVVKSPKVLLGIRQLSFSIFETNMSGVAHDTDRLRIPLVHTLLPLASYLTRRLQCNEAD